MKNVFLLLFLVLTNTSFGQNGENPLPWEPPEPKYDSAPRFPGGSNAMMKYFEDSVRYPEPEKSKNIYGNVFVKFVVTNKAKVTNVQVTNGVPGGPNLAKEAVRLIESMPDWIPATLKGKPVEAEYNLSIPFQIKK